MRDEEGPSGFGQVSLIGIVSFGPRLVSNIYSIFKSFKTIRSQTCEKIFSNDIKCKLDLKLV